MDMYNESPTKLAGDGMSTLVYPSTDWQPIAVTHIYTHVRIGLTTTMYVILNEFGVVGLFRTDHVEVKLSKQHQHYTKQ